MNDFDQAARYAAKLDPPGFFRWLFDGPLVFRDWLDTRTIPFPGEPDRTCDTVAGFENPKDIDQPFAVVVEFQSQPASDAVERLLEYVVRLRRELRHGSQRKNKYLVAGALLNLTGPAQKPLLEMLLSTVPEIGLRFHVLVRTLREEEAASTLAAIESGETARCILPWIPLMHGGKEAGIIAKWKEVVSLNLDSKARKIYAGLAFIFADLAACLQIWHDQLEEWDVGESQVINAWRAEGKVIGQMETTRAKLLRALELRFRKRVSRDIIAIVKAMTDLEELDRWFDVALTAATLDDFRAAVQEASTTQP